MFPETQSAQKPETVRHGRGLPLLPPLPPPAGFMARPLAWPGSTALYWRGRVRDELTVRLVVAPRNRIEVQLWWNRRGGRADVQLVFGLYDDAVEFGSLSGNGFDTPRFHQAGFGTLAVNIGIRALRSACPGAMGVHGVLSNTAEQLLTPEERAPLEAARRAFWQRFGLAVIADGAPPLDYLRGTVGALRTVPDGYIAGQFARDLDLEEFAPV